MVSAYRAVVLTSGFDFAELHRLRVESQQAVGEQFTHASEILQRLSRLYSAEHAGNGSQHSSLGTGGNSIGWWWRLEQASVAGCAREMGERLSFEAQDASMGEWFASFYAGIVDEELHREVVGAVDDEVVVADDVKRIVGHQELTVGVDLHVGVNGEHLCFCRLDLWHSHIGSEMNHLPLEV